VTNRGLLAVAQRLELGVVATNAVRFATPKTRWHTRCWAQRALGGVLTAC
jgi:hypothetical protein